MKGKRKYDRQRAIERCLEGESMSLKTFIKKSLLLPIIRYATQIAVADLPKFANTPKNLKIQLPRRISHSDRMYIGDDVSIGPGAFLVAQTHYPTKGMQDPQNPRPVQMLDPKITIGDRVTSTGGLTIAAMCDVMIEDDVMFASNILVSDGLHGYETADEPYKYQPMGHIAPVTIKRGCWIGQNVVVMPGVTIGELSIIGANSVVTHSIPARCIAVGAPAKVIKKWNADLQRWAVIA